MNRRKGAPPPNRAPGKAPARRGGAGARSLLARRDGVALLMVLFIMVALTSLVVALTDTTQRHLHLTQYYKNHLQAFWTAQSGIQAAVALLQVDHQLQPGHDAFDSAWNCESTYYQENAMLFLSVPLCGSSLIEPGILLTPSSAAGSLDPQPTARKRCPIIDENRKLSLFTLVKNRNQQNEETHAEVFDRLTYLLMYLLSEDDLAGLGEPGDAADTLTVTDPKNRVPISYGRAADLAGYLVDWIDSSSNTSGTELNPDQAEDACPEDGLPYTTKNGMMDSVDELALVCGFRQIPRHVIDELARNLTVYELETNINTATQPVLQAFCAQILNSSDDTTDAEAIYQALHPVGDDIPDAAITDRSAYASILGGVVSSNALISGLQQATVVESNFFRLGIRGVVINTSTGSVEANTSVNMVVQRGGGARAPAGQAAGGSLRLFYYREG